MPSISDPSGDCHENTESSMSSQAIPRHTRTDFRSKPFNIWGSCADCPKESGIYPASMECPISSAILEPIKRFLTRDSPLIR